MNEYLPNKTYFGDCRETMRAMISSGVKVQMCVTSPPYFGLRDYGHDEQIGLEKTPEEYVKALVETFRLVRELLKDDGVLWLNLGDSYCNSNGFARASEKYQRKGRKNMPANDRNLNNLHEAGYKTKDLIGIPWLVAFALRSDGWYLRQDIIWSKPNPMPESVTDRCTKSHEYIFLLAKSQKYFYDAEAVKEIVAREWNELNGGNLSPTGKHKANGKYREKGGNYSVCTGTRNRRSVWTIPTKSYKGAHFAVFPAELIAPCILAGSRPGDIVLDPFMGSGTTSEVCQRLGRKWIGCELNEQYAPLQHERTAQKVFDFNEETA